MTDLFTLDVMVGYVLLIQDQPCLFPAVTLKLLKFPSLTVHCIPPSEQQELKRKHHKEFPSEVRNRIVFKKGKSCSFKLSKQDTQKLCVPLTIKLNDAWYLPLKELAKTSIDILVPQGSFFPPISSSKQVYELCNANGSKVAMIELSYKLKRTRTDIVDAVGSHIAKPEENAFKKNNLEKPIMGAKEILLLQEYPRSVSDMPVGELHDKLTICPPPLLYSAGSANENEKLQSQVEPVTSQDVSQVVWPNGYIHTEPVSKGDDFIANLLPSCPQHVPSPVAQNEVNTSNNNNQNFWILRALVKELSAMEQLLNSKGIVNPVQNCSDVYVQTDNLSNSEADDKSTPTRNITKKLGVKQKRFTRECCAPKLDHSRLKQTRKVKCKHTAMSPQNKVTSPGIKSIHQTTSPRNKTAPSVLHQSRTRKLKIRSTKPPPPQIHLDSAVSKVSQINSHTYPKNTEPASEEFSINTSVEHKGEQSKLNLEIRLPTVTTIPSVSNMSLKQDDAISSTSFNNAVGLLTVPAADSVTPSVTPMASTIPLSSASQTATPLVSAMALSPASQSVHLTQASSNDIQSYTNLSLSESSEDILNESHISNLVFSAKHLKAVIADDKATKDKSPGSDHDKPSNTEADKPEAISPAASSESVQYKDDFESSDCISTETLSSSTS